MRCLGRTISCRTDYVRKTTALGRDLLSTRLRLSTLVCEGQEQIKYRPLYLRRDSDGDEGASLYYELGDLPNGEFEKARTPDSSRRSRTSDWREIFYDSDDLASGGDNTTVSSSISKADVSSPSDRGSGKHDREGMQRLDQSGPNLSISDEHVRYVRYLDDFPVVSGLTLCGQTLRRRLRADKIYVVQTDTKGRRALPPDDHRPRRPGAGPDVRERDDGVCGRAVGPALDHLRFQPRGAGAGQAPADDGEVRLPPASPVERGGRGAQSERDVAHRPDGQGSRQGHLSSARRCRTSRSRASPATPRSIPSSPNTSRSSRRSWRS